MPVVYFSKGRQIEVPEGTTVLQAARSLGLVIESPCNGAGTCGKCKVKLSGDSMDNVRWAGNHVLPEVEQKQGYVLSCEARVYGDVTVYMPEEKLNHTLKILSEGQSFDISLNPHIKKLYDNEHDVTRVTAGSEVLSIEKGDTTGKSYGLSLDIGTTTLVLSLVDLNTGREIDSTSAMNPQAVYAQDVLSRIKFAGSTDGLRTMYSSLIDELNQMIRLLTVRNSIAKENIYEAVFSGNTCMLHLASNTSPVSLGKYPYTPVIDGALSLKASGVGLGISKIGVVYFPPGISAYVGADITSGILASSLFERTGVTLFVDIGTNGEMVIASDGRLTATSTAAGPAFEGMNITKGMRAGDGAIEEFEIKDGHVCIKVIGDTKAVGICGSGLIDIVGELVAHGVIGKNGKFVNPDSGQIPSFLLEKLLKQDGKTVFQIDGEVVLSQRDVRQVQLAKGAIRAGIEFLLKSKQISPSKVDTVLIAGSFGYHLRAKSLINIGLLPAEFQGKIEFVGNTSSSGGRAFLLGGQYRSLMEQRVKDVEILELANAEDFDKIFVKTLSFDQ